MIKHNSNFLVFWLMVWSSLSFAASNPQLVAPPYNVVSRDSVNTTTNQVQITHADVAIGGGMGLNHSISMHNSSWAGPDTDPSGPVDQYSGRLICVKRNGYNNDQRVWLIASDGSTSQLFDPGDGLIPGDGLNALPAPKPLGDQRYSLLYESVSSTNPSLKAMVMTKPDGTKIIYGASAPYTNINSGFCPPYDMVEIRRPDGFTVSINPVTNGKPGSVISNTGFQLRYYFIPKDASVDPVHWWGLNPAYVVAINNAVQYCPHTANTTQLNSDCATNGWQKVQYIWPNNMPQAMLNGTATFSVINPNGVKTDYEQNAFAAPNQPTTKATRLVRVSRSGQYVRDYSYIPYREKGAGAWGIIYFWPSELGVLEKSSRAGEDLIRHTMSSGTQGVGLYTSSSGYQTIESTYTNPDSNGKGGLLKSIQAWNYAASFYSDGNLQTYIDLTNQVPTTYGYDTRGNVTSITSPVATQTADYPLSCDNNNYKYCNSPNWIVDGKGNKTNYTYHPTSGQVASITYPANKRGISTVVRYKYGQTDSTPYYAYTLNSAGAKVQQAQGVWLKREERTCADSPTVGNASCAGGDEVVTTYEYKHDNLLLTGTTVYSQKDNKTLRTCYRYDKYGNQISKTEPNANLASCD